MLGFAIALGAVPCGAAPPSEQLVVTQLADPDPNYVPPPAESKSRSKALQTHESPTLDQAMQDFGRAIGQAAMLEQRQVDARCKSIDLSKIPVEQRYLWEANCRYQRH
jgi:hypothetical protein